MAGSTCNISQVVITMSEAELACKLLGKRYILTENVMFENNVLNLKYTIELVVKINNTQWESLSVRTLPALFYRAALMIIMHTKVRIEEVKH